MTTVFRRVVGIASATALTALGGALGSPASAATVSCGQVITQNTTLRTDVGPCTGDGIVAGADGITVDLGGHTVRGTVGSESSAVGVRLPGRQGVTVTNGTVTGFGAGVAIAGGGSNTVSAIKATANVGPPAGDFGDGILVDHSTKNRIKANTATQNGPYDGIGLIGGSAFNLVSANVVDDNCLGGLIPIPRTTVLGCAQAPFDAGIDVGDDPAETGLTPLHNIVQANTVRDNASDGIRVQSAENVVSANIVIHNGFDLGFTGDGINVGFPGHIEVGNVISSNIVRSSAHNGIHLQGTNSVVVRNISLDNNQAGFAEGWDLLDVQPDCDANTWANNRYRTANPACVAGHAGAPVPRGATATP